MTQSDQSNNVFTIDVGDLDTSKFEDFYVNDSDSFIYTTVNTSDITLTENGNLTDITIIDEDWRYANVLDPDEIEKMCKQYPGLEKVWRNFKSVYDMTRQDYLGKKKAGELNDDIPF